MSLNATHHRHPKKATNTEKSSEKDSARGVLGDFSLSQIVASGLAAATSFALSSQIGFAGSVIGVVIGAVASAAASQIYKSLLSKSAEKLRDLGSDDSSDIESTNPDKTVLDSPQNLSDTDESAPWQPTSISGQTRVSEVSESGTPVAPHAVRSAAHARRQAQIRRRAMLITAGFGIAAVLVFAVVVNLATHGAGIGNNAASEAAQEDVSSTSASSNESSSSTTSRPWEHTSEPKGNTSSHSEDTETSSSDESKPVAPEESTPVGPTTENGDTSESNSDESKPSGSNSDTTGSTEEKEPEDNNKPSDSNTSTTTPESSQTPSKDSKDPAATSQTH